MMSGEEGIDSSESLMEAFTPELKEKMYKLEKENEILRRRVTTSESSAAATTDTQQVEGLRLELVDKSLEIDKLKQGLAKKGKELEALSHFRDNYDQIKSQIKAKDVEIEKLKKYLNKAKKIIEGFGDKKDVAADSAEVQQLKGFLQERDREIERMERTFEQERQTREKEERLILSAWYNLGVKFHQLQSKERLVTQGSFLTQQRQAALKRHAPSRSPQYIRITEIVISFTIDVKLLAKPVLALHLRLTVPLEKDKERKDLYNMEKQKFPTIQLQEMTHNERLVAQGSFLAQQRQALLGSVKEARPLKWGNAHHLINILIKLIKIIING
uniref:Hook C-terminal domain-containing protein n=1 Tax=Amphimedon queenslandica TaxID=400682 RepID=A0A1X7U8P2_AMPQE